MIAYIDECKAKRYVFALHLVDPKDQTRLRRLLIEKLLPGQRSIHFRKESPRRRRQLVKAFLDAELRVVIFHDSKLLSDLHSGNSWDHRFRHQEPLLWVADAVAWCVNRGGEWERMVRPMIVATISC